MSQSSTARKYGYTGQRCFAVLRSFGLGESEHRLLSVRVERRTLVCGKEFFDALVCARPEVGRIGHGAVDDRRGEMLLAAEECASFFQFKKVTSQSGLGEHGGGKRRSTWLDPSDEALRACDGFGIDN